LPDPDTLIRLAECGSYNAGLGGGQALEHAIKTGRGGVWLELTEAPIPEIKTRWRRPKTLARMKFRGRSCTSIWTLLRVGRTARQYKSSANLLSLPGGALDPLYGPPPMKRDNFACGRPCRHLNFRWSAGWPAIGMFMGSAPGAVHGPASNSVPAAHVPLRLAIDCR
jgi:hypothetical protein